VKAVGGVPVVGRPLALSGRVGISKGGGQTGAVRPSKSMSPTCPGRLSAMCGRCRLWCEGHQLRRRGQGDGSGSFAESNRVRYLHNHSGPVHRVGVGMDQGGDPWQDIREVAQAIGYECFFDPRGCLCSAVRSGLSASRCSRSTKLNPSTLRRLKSFRRADVQRRRCPPAVFEFAETRSARSVRNDRPVVLTPGRLWAGTQRLTFRTSPDQDQAQDAADAVLFNSAGRAETVTVTCVPHPALEPGDIVKSRSATSRLTAPT